MGFLLDLAWEIRETPLYEHLLRRVFSQLGSIDADLARNGEELFIAASTQLQLE